MYSAMCVIEGLTTIDPYGFRDANPIFFVDSDEVRGSQCCEVICDGFSPFEEVVHGSKNIFLFSAVAFSKVLTMSIPKDVGGYKWGGRI